MLEPLRDQILIKTLEPDEKTPGGIIIPGNSTKGFALMGTVLATGTGHVMENGAIVPCVLKKGDTVIYDERASTRIEHKGEKYTLIREMNVLGIVKDDKKK